MTYKSIITIIKICTIKLLLPSQVYILLYFGVFLHWCVFVYIRWIHVRLRILMCESGITDFSSVLVPLGAFLYIKFLKKMLKTFLLRGLPSPPLPSSPGTHPLTPQISRSQGSGSAPSPLPPDTPIAYSEYKTHFPPTSHFKIYDPRIVC